MCSCTSLMQTGNLEFLVQFSGFSRSANRWIASSDLRCGHKVREYMKENTLERIDSSKKSILELKGIKKKPPRGSQPGQSRRCLPCKRKTGSTHVDECGNPRRPRRRYRFSRRLFGYRTPPKCIPKAHTTSLTSIGATAPQSMMDDVQHRASLHLKCTPSSSSIPGNEGSLTQANELRTLSSSPSHLSLPSPSESASLPSHHTDPTSVQEDSSSYFSEQCTALRADSSGESSGSGRASSDSSGGLPPSPPTPPSESENWCPCEQQKLSTQSTRAPDKLRRNQSRGLRRSLQAAIRPQSGRKELFKTQVKSVQSTVKYDLDSTAYTRPGAPTVNYNGNFFPLTRAARKSNRAPDHRNFFPLTRTARKSDRAPVPHCSRQISYSIKTVQATVNSKRNLNAVVMAMRKSCESSGTRGPWNHDSLQREVQSPPHLFSNGMENGYGSDSVGALSPDLEDSFLPSPESGPTVFPLTTGIVKARNQDVQLASTGSCSSGEESSMTNSVRENGSVPSFPLDPASSDALIPVLLPAASSPDVYIVTGPVGVTNEETPKNLPSPVKPLTLEDHRCVISHGEYIILSQNAQQAHGQSIQEVTIPPASIGVSSNVTGGSLTRDRGGRQSVAPPAPPTTLPPNSVARREVALRPKNGFALHRPFPSVHGATTSHLTSIGEVLLSKRPSIYTPAKAVNPYYQILLDALEFSIYQVTAGKEAYVYIENNVDESQPPFNFRYITERIHSENVPPRLPRSAMEVCNCSDNCLTNSSQCCCTADLTASAGYFRNGRMKGNHRLPIAECWTSCTCSPQCYNRVVQRGRWVSLCIFRTENRGWGVKSVVYIPKGTFLATYVGEVISDDEAEERGRDNSSQGLTYLFDLDYWIEMGTSVFTVDATNCGNVSRFFNHSVSTLWCYGRQPCNA